MAKPTSLTAREDESIGEGGGTGSRGWKRWAGAHEPVKAGQSQGELQVQTLENTRRPHGRVHMSRYVSPAQ